MRARGARPDHSTRSRGRGLALIAVVCVAAAGAWPAGPAAGADPIPPVVTAVAPTALPASGGAVVTVTGSGFASATQVQFGTTIAPAFTVVSDSEISATAPARPAGTVPVRVTANGKKSATTDASKVTFVVRPVVKKLAPSVGPPVGGTTVTVTGKGFTGATAVRFGSVEAPFTVLSPTKIAAVAPAQPIGPVDVVVTGVDGPSATGAASRFTYAMAAAITAVSPASSPAAGGASVTITGTGFTGASAVTFAKSPASSFTVVDDSTIVAVTPARAAGTVAVRVTTPSGKTPTGPAAKHTFVVAPTVTKVERGAGLAKGGTTVTITGKKLTGATAITFGGVPASSFTVQKATRATAVTPPHAPGEVDVTVHTAGGPNAPSAAARFWYHPMDARAPGGLTTLLIGQELGATGGFSDFAAGYADHVGNPAGVTIYTDLRLPASLNMRIDVGTGVMCGICYLTNPRYDRSMIAIGLYLVDALPMVNSGALDGNIAALGRWIKAADRPVLLRIGYEFDGSWNGYPPAQYVAAFRRIMDRLRADGVDNVVSVWQSSGYQTNQSTLLQWYPGDDYVDVVAYSYFNQASPWAGMIDIARAKGKPVMIAEATPKRNLSLGNATTHWSSWFAGFFQHIQANQDVIKWVAYINTRWFDQPAWDASWGDSRVQIRPEIKAQWIAQLQSGIWSYGDLSTADNPYVLTPDDLTPP